MTQTFLPIRFLDFSSGMNTKVVNHLLLDSEVKLARNCVLDEIGCLKKRKGYTQIGTQITSGTAILGNYYFTDKDVTYSQHLVACNVSGGASASVYFNDGGTWTASLTNLTASKKVRFESFLDRVFAFNGTDAPKSWSGTGSWDSTDLTSAPVCKYGRVYQDRVYLAHESSNQSRLYYSSVPSSNAISWTTATDYLDVNPEDGSGITALGENSGRLLIFKDNSMFRWNGISTEPDPIIDIGTSSQESVKTINGLTYFFNRYGVYVYDGGMPYSISRKIQDWIDAIDQSKLADITAEVDNEHYYCAVGDVTIGGVTYSNTMLVYNIPLKGWTIWTMTDTPKFLAHYYSSGARYLSFGDANGEVFKLNDGNNDDDSAIEVNIETKAYDLHSAEEEKKFIEIYILSKKARGSVQVSYKLDDVLQKNTDYLSKDVTRLPSNLQGKEIAIILSESGIGEEWSFRQLTFRDVTLMGTV